MKFCSLMLVALITSCAMSRYYLVILGVDPLTDYQRSFALVTSFSPQSVKGLAERKLESNNKFAFVQFASLEGISQTYLTQREWTADLKYENNGKDFYRRFSSVKSENLNLYNFISALSSTDLNFEKDFEPKIVRLPPRFDSFFYINNCPYDLKDLATHIVLFSFVENSTFRFEAAPNMRDPDNFLLTIVEFPKQPIKSFYLEKELAPPICISNQKNTITIQNIRLGVGDRTEVREYSPPFESFVPQDAQSAIKQKILDDGDSGFLFPVLITKNKDQSGGRVHTEMKVINIVKAKFKSNTNSYHYVIVTINMIPVNKFNLTTEKSQLKSILFDVRIGCKFENILFSVLTDKDQGGKSQDARGLHVDIKCESFGGLI